MPPPDKYQPYQQALEQELKAVFESREGFLYDVLRYHLGWVDQQGQPASGSAPLNLQSALALASCDSLGGGFAKALPVAASVELVYNFTLVHGDVQAGRTDPGDRPSIWWVWGPAQAINAGDGLHALGRTTMMRLAQNGVPADRVLRAVRSLDQACLSLCEGQYMDLQFQDQMMVTTADYLDMIGRKAGALASCAAEAGALAAGVGDQACASFAQMGRGLGMAWQIARDIDDLWGEHGDGMTPSNVLNKKKSLPLVHTLENASVSVKRELGAIYMKRVLEAADIAKMVEVLDGAGARQASQEKAQELVDQAIAGLTGVAPDEIDDLAALGRWAAAGGR
ncbi:MAG: polyprenyl synthetase family protein [Chloroflexi bacterium]|nr:polyprenyl synthetase family protein [Chloroflexota bacterium]MDA1270317.1 polyprenyl synthetase family protein [Chloroflexota bacterium]